MGFYHFRDTLQGINEVLARKFWVGSQLTIIIGTVDTLLSLDKKRFTEQSNKSLKVLSVFTIIEKS